MANLFLARAATMDGAERLLVIKRIHASKARDSRLVDLFLQEARVAALLEHPNLVQTYDVGRVDGEYFFAMEYLHGLDLHELVVACQQEGQEKPPLPVSLAIIHSMLLGLHYAHEKLDFAGEPLNLVHRDITPQNVRVTYDGVVKVLDFGLAAAGRPATLVIAGKAPYMSPEQVQGEVLDRRSDLFSVGILLYELTVGRRLYRSQGDLEARRRMINEPAVDPSKVVPSYPKVLREIVMRALAKAPEDRYVDAAQMARALEAYIEKEGFSTAVTPFMMPFREELPLV